MATPENTLATSSAMKSVPSGSMMAQLQSWQQSGWLSGLDLALARLVTSKGTTAADNAASTEDEAVQLLTALLSYQVMRGHVCLNLIQLVEQPHLLLGLSPQLLQLFEQAQLPSPASLLRLLTVADFESALHASTAVAWMDSTDADFAHENGPATPLVYAAGALYFRRFWHYEQRISLALRARMKSGAMEQVSGTQLAELLDELFPVAPADTEASLLERVSWQKLACANTLRSRFSVITGGPGTGKTYTVVRLLALLQRLAMNNDGQRLRIRLAAPTGKAAARLKESIQTALSEMLDDPRFAAWQGVLQQIDSESSTLHKLLGTQQHTRAFRHHGGHPLSLDVLVIDEASMVDIEMMDAVLAALPKGAQLVLLGDKDQLASVEAGAVLGQLCIGAEGGRYRSDSFDYLQSVSEAQIPLELFDAQGPDYLQHVVMLRVSRRFDGRSGIGHLANSVNAGNAQRLRELLPEDAAQRAFSDIQLLTPARGATSPEESESSLLDALRPLCTTGFKAYWKVIEQRPGENKSDNEMERWARDVLKAYAKFQLLTPLREGVFGVQGLNQQVERWLTFMPKQTPWYEGRPVIVTQNDYSLNLRNGDIGIVLKWPRDGRERVVFVDSEGRLRWILPSRLRQVETVFAMTVHKSQGSEFAHTVMVMPANDNPVLCRELVYTGITRAAKQLTMVVPRWQVLEQAVQRQTIRAGQLHL